jgi:hypothetical protein
VPGVAAAAILPKTGAVIEQHTAKFGREKTSLSGRKSVISGVFDTCRKCSTLWPVVGYTGTA